MWFDASGSPDVLATLATNASCLGNANTKKRPSDRLLGGFGGYVREVEGKPYELTEGSRTARPCPGSCPCPRPWRGRFRDRSRYGLAPRAFSMSVIRPISDCWASTMPCASRFSTSTVHRCTQPSAMWMPPLWCTVISRR